MFKPSNSALPPIPCILQQCMKVANIPADAMKQRQAEFARSLWLCCDIPLPIGMLPSAVRHRHRNIIGFRSCLWESNPPLLLFPLNEYAIQNSENMSDSGERRTQSRLEKQPERKHPFVPELYGGLVKGTLQNIMFPHAVRASSLAYLRAKFVPEIDLRKNLESVSSEDLPHIEIRAHTLTTHACENTRYKVSESTGESDIRSDLFGLIRQDRRLRMFVHILMTLLMKLNICDLRDKTPYQYRYTDTDTNTSKAIIRKRYPDITFGLATFMDVSVQHQIKQRNGETSCDRLHVEVHHTLTKERIFKQLFHRRCGLVVDPRWGAVDLVFPWALFEAKKTSAPLEDAERQLCEGASIYLAMLDDLARDPKSPDRYQEGGGSGPQLFGFASSGPMLWIYTIFDWFGNYVRLSR